MSNNKSASGGLGFFSALAILFIGLKLAGYIKWSWWWVLSPLWGSFVAALFVLLFICVGFFVSTYKKG